MTTAPVCKLDKIAHEIFASTLRAPYSSPRDAVPDSRRLKYADIVAGLAQKISEPRTLKLNLLRLPQLKKLPVIESDFLKAATPVLVCAARPYNNQYILEHGTALLFTWAGCGGASVASPCNDVTELFISPQAFKNTLLKLLNGNSDDHRIVSMREKVTGVPWSNSIEAESAIKPAEDNDEAECTFHPRVNKYPRYLRSAPQLAYPPSSLSGKLKKFLDMPPPHMPELEEEEPPFMEQEYDEMDYGSPFNNSCPLGNRAHYEDDLMADFCHRGRYTQKIDPARAQYSVYNSPSNFDTGISYRPSPVVFDKRDVGHDVGRVAGDIDAEIDAIMASLPSMRKRITPPPKPSSVPQLRFVTPLRSHLCATVGSATEDLSPSAWKDNLRGGYINTGMKFPAEPEPSKYAGSLKQCDYIIPAKMALPSFSRRVMAQGGMYDCFKPQSGNTTGKSPLDILEAQLAQPTVTIGKMI
ncbi:aspartate aminotransferase, putative [Babesia ovis]|uniref:Aspartate aminotransferase, putative n=1 Tax=Babesia ovis TaxID=5869 RepID=A0A9W5TDX2_BABOV|nr:aspartate aminotransferase, putative [Babesia ovis]